MAPPIGTQTGVAVTSERSSCWVEDGLVIVHAFLDRTETAEPVIQRLHLRRHLPPYVARPAIALPCLEIRPALSRSRPADAAQSDGQRSREVARQKNASACRSLTMPQIPPASLGPYHKAPQLPRVQKPCRTRADCMEIFSSTAAVATGLRRELEYHRVHLVAGYPLGASRFGCR